MSSEQNNIILEKKAFTPDNIVHPKEMKHYSNENDNSTDSTEQQIESKALLKTEKIIGNYTLTKQIDKSSYTKIFLAKHILTGEYVNIRIINKQLFKNDLLSMTRFNKELKIIKTVKHQNIIKLIEIIETNTKIYLISEYYPYNLLSYIKSEKKISEDKARFLFQQLLNALNYLHLMGISHRNIKPEIILLDDKYTNIKITGFGVSTFSNPGSLLSSPVGTLIYAPPEMILSQKYDGELNDVWDAGIVLYTMVCGNLPFSQDNQDVNINHIIEGFYDIPKDISTSCVEVIKACLECNPEKRITFNKLKDLSWIKCNNFNYVKGININEEKIIVDDIILHECKKYISANNQDILNKIKKSVIENKFDEFSSLYYLVFQKQIKKGYQSIFNINKKDRNHKTIVKYINFANNSEDNNSEKDDLSNYSSHTHTNSFSSYLSYKNKMDFLDNSNKRKPNIINQHKYSQTIRNTKNNRNNIINISSSNFKNKNYLFSPKNTTINYKQYHKKLLNRLKTNELITDKVVSSPINKNILSPINKITSSPNVYKKKTHYINTPKLISIKSRSDQKVEKSPKTVFSMDKIKMNEEYYEEINKNTNPKIENNNNENTEINEIKPLHTLFVNRVSSINDNYYSTHKRKNKSSEGFYLNARIKRNLNKARINLISINKKYLFIKVNNNENTKEKNDTNIEKILMDDQPVTNFSINFNNTLLLNNTKNIRNEYNSNELTLNNNNESESNCLNKKTLTKNNKTAKSYKRLDYFFQTPKKPANINYTNFDYKYGILNNDNYLKVKSSHKNEFILISDSFNKFIPQKKKLRPSVLRNTINDNYYNTTLYNEEKTLNKIRSFGGMRITKRKTENNLQKIFSQNTVVRSKKKYISNNLNLNEQTDKKIINDNNNTIRKKKGKKISVIKFNETSKLINDVKVLDLSCLKFCIYEELIEKICKILKKYKIKYCFINQNKIHCSGKCGDFFDIEINNFKTKNGVVNKKKTNNNINIYKNNNNIIGNNNKISVQKMGYTTLGFKKNNGNNLNEKGMYYITFNCKKNDFRKNNTKLINDILY